MTFLLKAMTEAIYVGSFCVLFVDCYLRKGISCLRDSVKA